MASRRGFSSLPSTVIAVAAFVAVGFALTRAVGNWKEYRAQRKPDPSAAELYLDTAGIWGGAGFAALVVGTVAAGIALRRR